MIIPSNFIIDHSLKVGIVYKFCAPEYLNSSVWHYFIVIAIDGDDNFLLVCTTQLENRLRYFEKNKIDPGSLAYLRPNAKNGLTKDSYIDCNEYFTVPRESLVAKHQAGKLQIAGEINQEEYKLILDAIELSETFALPKSILKYS